MDFHHATVFERIADAIPDAPLLAQGDRVVSWGECEQRASRLAGLLADAGLDIQAHVAIDLYNSNEWLEAYHGIVKGRHVPVSINYRYLDDELAYLFENSESEALIYHASLGERVVEAADRAIRGDLLVP
jgi:acyl-CoA synthetase (AMP-forming)/AMP-acid ligase II